MATDLGKIIADRAAKRGPSVVVEEDDPEAPSDEATSPGDEGEGGGEGEALDNMVEALGLDGTKAEAFKTAMEDYVKSCMEKG